MLRLNRGIFFTFIPIISIFNMKNWTEEILGQMHTQLEGTSEKDLRFYRIAEFERMIRRTNEFAPACRECSQSKAEIEKVVALIGESIHQPGKQRRNYDQLIDRLAVHQRKAHGFYPPYYFTYLYSFFGILAGCVLGVLVGLLFSDQPMSYFVLTGFITGLLIVRYPGSRKDQHIRDQNKLL